MIQTVYLAGEIHSNWREELKERAAHLPLTFWEPVTNHEASDNCGVHILGEETNPFWKDRKGAQLNAIRTRTMIQKSDLVIVKFGEQYKQWNAAFDAGFAHALDKPLIILHPPNFNHALKEVDAAAQAVAETVDQVIALLTYAVNGELS